LRFHYGIDLVDVIECRGPAPSLVLALVQRLPDTSMTVALANGGIHHFGWGLDRHMAADTYDAINQQTRATGNWGKKPPTFPEWPRPSDKPKSAPAPKKRVSVADLHARISRR
jgi:hypothetical protein